MRSKIKAWQAAGEQHAQPSGWGRTGGWAPVTPASSQLLPSQRCVQLIHSPGIALGRLKAAQASQERGEQVEQSPAHVLGLSLLGRLPHGCRLDVPRAHCYPRQTR